MRNDHEKIAKLFEEINSNNKTIKDLKDERDEKTYILKNIFSGDIFRWSDYIRSCFQFSI